MPSDDEILEANRALTRLSRKLSTACGENDETAADVIAIRRGLGISFERAPTLGEVFDPAREPAPPVGHDQQMHDRLVNDIADRVDVALDAVHARVDMLRVDILAALRDAGKPHGKKRADRKRKRK